MSRRIRKAFPAVLILLVAPAFLLSGISPDTHAETIHIASEPDYPPFCVVDENGEAAGFSIDLFRAAAEAAGLQVQIKIGVWSKIMADLAEGRIDALPLVGRTPERESLFDFTMPYLSLHGAVFVRKGTKGITSIEDLKNRKIAVMRGDNAEEFLRRENISDRLSATSTFEEAFRDLALGEYDAVVTQRIMGLYLLENLRITSVIPLDFQIPQFRQDFCFAVRKGDTHLLNRLNEGLSIVIADKTYEKIREKWFGSAFKEKVAVIDILRVSGMILIPFVAVLAVTAAFLLRKEVKRQTGVLIREIAERKKTEHALRDSEARLRAITDNISDVVFVTDLELNTTYVSPSVKKLTGIPADDYLEMQPEERHPPETLERFRRIMAEELENEKNPPVAIDRSRIIEGEHFTSEGGAVFVSMHVSFLRDGEGGPTGILGVTRDITEHKRLDEAVKENHARLLAIFDGIDEPIYVADPETFELLYVNRALEAAFGAPAGRKCHDYLQNRSAPCLFCTNNIILKDPENRSHKWEFRNEINKRWYRCIDKAITWPDGRIVRYEMAVDITALKDAEDELRRLKDTLEKTVAERTAELKEKISRLDRSEKAMLLMVEDLNTLTAELQEERRKLTISNQELEAFTYSVSHDLRAPLRAIDGFGKILQEDHTGKLDKDGNRLIDVIRTQTAKMDQLICDLLNLSRVTRIEMNPILVDMRAVVASMCREASSESEKEDFEIIISEMPQVLCDLPLIKQVWLNLIGNAYKYSSRSQIKKIEIGAEEKDKEIAFFIRDHGVGFDETYAHKLFTVFQRLHGEREFEGNGVGLAIVKSIVERHGGRVWATGQVGGGAVFSFALPRREIMNLKKRRT